MHLKTALAQSEARTGGQPLRRFFHSSAPGRPFRGSIDPV